MNRLTLAQLEARCQKPDYRHSGNWMARRVSRPMALRVTWVVSPYGIPAHAATCLALLIALSAAVCFATGATMGWFVGAALLQLWYLLDHVDGQLARLYGTSSLDGIQLDYLMHHLVNLLAPCSLGYGIWRATGSEVWLLLGFMFALGLLLLGLANDTRYKAFVARLKQLDQPLIVSYQGEAPARPNRQRASPPGTPPRLLRLGVHLARKLCEIHVVMNAVTAIVAVQCLAGSLLPLKTYLAVMAPLALCTSMATLARDIRGGDAERQFDQWFDSPPNTDIVSHRSQGRNTSPARELFEATFAGQ